MIGARRLRGAAQAVGALQCARASNVRTRCHRAQQTLLRHMQPGRRLCSCAQAASSPAQQAQAESCAPPYMSGEEIRARFLAFYEERGHKRMSSSSLVPEDPTVLLTIAGMLQFKPIFLGQQERSVPRATTTQKCVRTNDVENVGVTARHHTFFEMLGNFSFGDYFKEQACQWAWELSTDVLQLPAERLFVSVYEEDDEAFALWRDNIGVPENRIKRMGAADNFWASGPTGPCGPCSELYYDLHPDRGLANVDLDDGSRFIEFYNLVFMESNRDADGALTPLAAKNIDTGMGLERVAQILQSVPNNYETDLIMPLVRTAAELAGVDYGAADEGRKTSIKVIADHVRAVTYLISDGVIPSNVGRGYVVRRLLRRVVLKGRLLGIKDQFVSQIAAVAIELSTGCDPEVAQNADRIKAEIDREEARFLSTIAAGQSMLQKIVDRAKTEGGTVRGDDAFMMYDTYGFPFELTSELASGEGLSVDVAGFNAAMAEQRQRSKDARGDVDLTAGAALSALADLEAATQFTGDVALSLANVPVQALFVDDEAVLSCGAGDVVDVVLPRTPFYAEGGGQVGDTGVLASTSGAALLVHDTRRAAGGRLVVHRCEVQSGTLAASDVVTADVDAAFRRRTRANHTATHLLQAALKRVLGADVAQQGSLVQDERLRFDFNLPRAMTDEEIEQVEALVNLWIEESHVLESEEMPIADAKAAGATAMFGEKYGDVVRVVNVPGVSMELCGGTHVRNTAEIGAFKIVSESGIASGIRRVEAVAGPALVPYLNLVDSVVKKLTTSLKISTPALPERVAAMQKDIVARDKAIAALKSQLAIAKASSLADQAIDIDGAKVVVGELDGVDATSLQKAALELLPTLGDVGAVLLASVPSEGRVAFVSALSERAVQERGANAGKLVSDAAKVCGGGGGGKPALAQAGGRDVSKLPEALSAAQERLVEAMRAS